MVPLADAQIPVANIEYQYGFGVYETLRTKHGVIFFKDEHIERLFTSATIVGIEHSLTAALVSQYLADLMATITEPACNLKILLIGGKLAADALLFIIPLAPLFPDKKLYRSGAELITVPYERLLPKAKTLNMLGSYLAYRSAREQSAYDALLIDISGIITEGTRTNFFALKGQTIYEAPTEKILDGVTRRHVLQVAVTLGFTLLPAEITLGAVASYDGAFITSTSSKIIPIKKIDQTLLPIPESLRTLMRAFDEFLGAYEATRAQ